MVVSGDCHGGQLVGWAYLVLDRLAGALGLDGTVVQGEARAVGKTKRIYRPLRRVAGVVHVATSGGRFVRYRFGVLSYPSENVRFLYAGGTVCPVRGVGALL